MSATSPNGRLRVSARNLSGQEWELFAQTGIGYELSEQQHVIWTNNAVSRDPASALFVSDDAWVVIKTWSSTLIIIHPRGSVVGSLPLLVPGRIDQDVSHTTAGSSWSAEHEGFQVVDEQPCFVILTTWGHHIVVALETATELEPSEAALEERRAHAAALLEERRMASRLATALSFDPGSNALELIVEAGHPRARAAIPWLRLLEKDERWLEPDHAPGIMVYPLRQLARLGLRRLGEMTELGFPPTKLIAPPPPRFSNVFGAEQLEVGMALPLVLGIAGAPERVGANTWTYDVDRTPPFSVEVKWSVTTVASVQQIAPHWERTWPDEDVLHECKRVTGMLRAPQPN